MSTKKRMKVDYFIPGQEPSRPIFRYLLSAENSPSPGKIRVSIADLGQTGHPSAVSPGFSDVTTGSYDAAFRQVIDRLNSHHDKLRPHEEAIDGDGPYQETS